MPVKHNTSSTSWELGILAIITLLLNIPMQFDMALFGLWILLALLIALSVNLSVLLTTGEISAAHVFSLMAFLMLGHNGQGAEALWATAVGSLLGGLIEVARSEEWLPRRRVTGRSLALAAERMAQLTLSLMVAVLLYQQSGGSVPLGEQALSLWPQLLIYCLGYILIYSLFFVLRVRLDGKKISAVLASDWVTLGGVVLLPLPFAILGALIYTQLSLIAWLIFAGGLILVLIGVYGLSRTQFQYRQQMLEMLSISVVSQALRTNLELNALLSTIHLQVASLMDVENFIVALFDPAQNQVSFPLAIQHGRAIELPPRDLDNNLLDHVITTRQPLLIERNVIAEVQRRGLVLADTQVYSVLGVPLLAPERPLGAMLVASGDPERLLGIDDQRLLMNIAAQAGVAIENAQLYGQAQERALQLGALNSISTLLTGSLSPEKVVNLLASSVVAVTSCDAATVYLYQNGEFTLARNISLSEAFNQGGVQPLLAAALDTDDPQHIGRQPVVVTDVAKNETISEAYRAVMIREGKHAWVEYMLMSGDEPKGIIVALYNQPRTFTGEELDLFRTFAGQAGLAIHNAQLYSTIDLALDRRVNQLQALYDIGQELTAILNLQKVFELVVERAVEGTRSDAGLVIVGNEQDMSIEVVAHQGYPAGTFDNLYLGSGVTVAVFDTGDPIMAPDVSTHQQYRALSPTTRSQLSVPIQREGETLGVITIESDTRNAYSEDDITYVTQLATQAAIAIDNARLFKLISEGRDRLQVILDGMTEAVLLIDREGKIALANPRVESLLDLNPSVLAGRLVDDLVLDTGSLFAKNIGFSVKDLRRLVADLRAREWLGEDEAHHSYELQTPHRYVERNVVPMQDESGTLLGLLMVFSDETEEQELALRREDLNRMIVHDLRSPLTAVTASMKLLTDLAPADSEFTPIVQRTTEASMQAVRKLLNLVDSLLDIGKMESGQMRLEQTPTHFNAVASNVVMELDSLARELKVNLAVDVPYDMPTLYVDADQLERILFNLVDNALKFTPSNGQVTITAYLPADQAAPAGFVRTEVRDTGPGIADEYKERLFNRFAQVEGARGRRRGTGLGLTFCKLATEAHGGTIWIEDNQTGNGGTVFAFTLPVATEQPQLEEDLEQSDGELDGPLL